MVSPLCASSSHELSDCQVECTNYRTRCTVVAFLQSVFSCGSSGGLIVLFYIHIDCICAVFPRCASWYAFWGLKPGWMNNCTVCMCAVSLQCEWGSVSSNRLSDWMTYCTVGSCAVSHRCEPKSASSNRFSDWRTCHTVGTEVSVWCEWGNGSSICYLDWTTCHTVGNRIA